MKNSDLSYVYFVLDINSNAIKIGKAKDVYDRISTLQIGNPNPLTLLHHIECISEQYSFFLERKFHELFQELHLNGEWFKYEKERFKELILDEINIEPKQKREPLTRSTLFGEETIFDVTKHPRCFFYTHLVAQIKDSYEKSLKLTVPYRTEDYPTDGKKMLLPFSHEVDKVFISNKRHEQNLKKQRFEKEKYSFYKVL